MTGILLFLLLISFQDAINPVPTSLGALWLVPSGRANIIFTVPILLSTAILTAQHQSLKGALEEMGLLGSVKMGFLFG